MRVLAVALLILVAGCAAPAATVPTPAPTVTKASDPFHPANGSAVADLAAPRPAPDVLVATPGFAEPNVAAAYDGRTLYVGNPGGVWRSDDAGKTWAAPKNANLEGGGDGDIAVDANGTVYYLGLLGKEGRTIPFMRSADQGDTWTDIKDVAAGSGSDREWIDSTPDGHLAATWRGKTGIEFNASQDGGVTWLPSVVTVGPDGDGGPVVHDPVTGALAISVIDQAAAAGTDAPVVHVYVSRDGGRTWTGHDTAKLGRTSPVEPNGYASDFPVLSFDGAGTLYLVYSGDASALPGGATPPEEAGRYGVFLQASKDLGATWSAPKLVSDPTKDARFPWIAAGAPGRLAVVWYENVRGTPGEAVPDEWNVRMWESIDGGAKSIVATLTASPNHTGSLCTSGTGCLAADRSLLDFFEVAVGLDGQPVVAFAQSTLGTGLGVAVKPTEIHFVTVAGTSLL
ncbi:MAG: hypothetical protein QOE90_2627 [Thermoplasmata archaeon]|nr:hypothetical protein [Thermoplasmata archaeon]